MAKHTPTNIFFYLSIGIAVVSLPVTLLFLQQEQDVRSQAQTPESSDARPTPMGLPATCERDVTYSECCATGKSRTVERYLWDTQAGACHYEFGECTNTDAACTDFVLAGTPAPQPSPVSPTTLFVRVSLPGISAGGNTIPNHQARQVTIQLYSQNTELLYGGTGTLLFSGESGLFQGTLAIPTTIPTGQYSVKLKLSNTLQRIVSPGLSTITQQAENQLPVTSLTIGDIDNNNVLDIADYNLLVSCFDQSSCTHRELADLNDDGQVNGIDYNIVVRGFSVRDGD